MRQKKVYLAVFSAAIAGLLFFSISLRAAAHPDTDGKTFLFEGSVTPDYVVDGHIIVGEKQEFLWVTLVYGIGEISAGSFAVYQEDANNGVVLLVNLSGAGPCEVGNPIAVSDAVIVVSEYPPGTEFPNAQKMIDLENSGTPDNPLYSFGTVKCTETNDNYRVIQMRRPTNDPFTIKFRVYGIVE